MTSPDPFEHPSLPILTEVGHDFRRQLEEEFGPAVTPTASAAAPAPAPRAPAPARVRVPARPRPRRRERATPRIVRRTLAFAGTLLLVGTAAIAERSVHGGDDHPTTGPTVLATGGDAAEPWRLSAYRREGDVCHAFVTGGAITSVCAAPLAPGQVRATSVLGVAHRYVVGLAGTRVRAVRVTVGGAAVTQTTSAAPDAGAAARARLPAGQRWFVAALPERADTRDAPARVTPEDGTGARTAPATLDCTLGQRSAPCARLARRRSGG